MSIDRNTSERAGNLRRRDSFAERFGRRLECDASRLHAFLRYRGGEADLQSSVRSGMLG